MGTVSAGGSIGPRYEPDQKALQRLEAYPETIHVDDLGAFGFHQSIINELRVHQLLVSNAQVRAWIERGIPNIGPMGCPKGPEGPRGLCGPTCKGPKCGCGTDCEAVMPGTLGTTDKHAMPWYVQHIMRQQRRHNRVN